MSHITEFLPVLRQCILKQTTSAFNRTDWREWRDCYQGGAPFRDTYLKKFDGKEEQNDFNRRKALTPIPSYGKKEINNTKNAVAQRLSDVARRGGSEKWQEAVHGDGLGVDLRGSSMNSFITKKILADLLVMGEIGVLIDAPRIRQEPGQVISKADVPANFQPYLNVFPVEASPILIPANNDSPSDWSHLLLESKENKFNLRTAESDCVSTFRYFWLDEDRGGLVSSINLDATGVQVGGVIETDLMAIPYVQFDIGASLMADVCSHQIALLNMISADSSYAIDANYSFLTRQRGNDGGAAGAHLKGGKGDDSVKTGSTRGLFYNKNEDRPAFISPPTQPMKASLELRRELKEEVHDLVMGAISDLGEDGSIEAGLGFIGSCIQEAEERCWDHWGIFEESNPDDRKSVSIAYPDSWSLKTDEQRNEEANAMLDLGAKIVGRKAKKQAAKMAVDIRYKGKISMKDLDDMKKEIDAAPYALSDPDIVIRAKKEGIFCVETAALALGAKKGEGEKALQDAADRASMVVAAQADVNAGNGNDDAQVDPQSQDKAKQGDDDAKLKEEGDAGRPTEKDEDES